MSYAGNSIVPGHKNVSIEDYNMLTDEYNKLKTEMKTLLADKQKLTNELKMMSISTDDRVKKKEINTQIAEINTALQTLSPQLTAAAIAYMQTDQHKKTEEYKFLDEYNPNTNTELIGGSKSRRRHRRHRKHARKTRRKRAHRSRAARKHKKYSRRR
jgi:hypothetical protein